MNFDNWEKIREKLVCNIAIIDAIKERRSDIPEGVSGFLLLAAASEIADATNNLCSIVSGA